MKKEQSADLGEEHRPYNSYTNGTAKTKLDQSFPPKEFGEAKGSKYQKQRSCQQ